MEQTERLTITVIMSRILQFVGTALQDSGSSGQLGYSESAHQLPNDMSGSWNAVERHEHGIFSVYMRMGAWRLVHDFRAPTATESSTGVTQAALSVLRPGGRSFT
jgi:hypothetical protein